MSTAPTHTTAARPSGLVRALRLVFAISVVFFLLAGLTIVILQSIDLAIGNAAAARGVVTALGDYAFGGAAFAGILSFLLEYSHTRGPEDDDD